MLAATAAAPSPVRVPEVRGLTVRAASAKLDRLGLGAAAGAVRVPGADGVLVARSRARRTVRVQSVAPGTSVPRGSAVSLLTTRGAFAIRARYRTLEVRGGRLRLGLQAPTCGQVDHVELGPRREPARTVVVWMVPGGSCNARRVVEVVPPVGYRRSTTLWSGPVELPDPKLNPERPVTAQSLVVEPDRRAVVVAYVRGVCEALASASAKLGAAGVRLDLRTGSTVAPQTVCTEQAVQVDALIRLPFTVPKGTRISLQP